MRKIILTGTLPTSKDNEIYIYRSENTINIGSSLNNATQPKFNYKINVNNYNFYTYSIENDLYRELINNIDFPEVSNATTIVGTNDGLLCFQIDDNTIIVYDLLDADEENITLKNIIPDKVHKPESRKSVDRWIVPTKRNTSSNAITPIIKKLYIDNSNNCVFLSDMDLYEYDDIDVNDYGYYFKNGSFPILNEFRFTELKMQYTLEFEKPIKFKIKLATDGKEIESENNKIIYKRDLIDIKKEFRFTLTSSDDITDNFLYVY